MSELQTAFPIEVKDLYSTLIATRNLEINLFWQRSNYFLVLNSGIVFGFFNLKETRYAIIFGLMGIITSALWFWVCLGSKFWQTRWEQRLLDFENEYLPGLDFFSAKPDRILSDVRRGLAFQHLGPIQDRIYRLSLRKPSVSFSMTLLSGVFVFGWLAFVIVFFSSRGYFPH
jgi:hypothetical protein